MDKIRIYNENDEARLFNHLVMLRDTFSDEIPEYEVHSTDANN